MKKYSLLLVFVLAGMQYLHAQYDDKARGILDAMSEKYKKIPAYTAKFSTSLVNEADGVNEKFTGEITIKGDKYILVTEEQEIINDGETVWTYLPDVNEVNIDNYEPDEDEITPSSIFDEYKKDYKYIWLQTTTEGGILCDVIDLVPNNAQDNQFFKIKMFISVKDKTLTKWTMFENSGNRHIYNVSDFKENVSIDNSAFAFDTSKREGVEIIDLR